MIWPIAAGSLASPQALKAAWDRLLNRVTVEGASPELRRRSRVIAAFIAILNLVVLVGGTIDLINHNWATAGYTFAGAVVVDLSLLVLKRGRVELVGHLVTGLFVLVLFGSAADKGGLLATEVAWQCAAIVFAVLVVGAPGALIWTLMASAGLIVHVRSFDPSLWEGKGGALAQPTSYAAEMALLYLAIWGLAYAFDRVRAEFLQRLETRNEEMRRVFDHARDGLLTIDRHGRIGLERSNRASEWLGDLPEGACLWDVLGRDDPQLAMWFRTSWECVLEGLLPREMTLAQMPRRVVIQGRTLDVELTLIAQRAAITGALVVLHDITDELALEHTEQVKRDLFAVFEHLRVDAGAVVEFLKEMDRLARCVVENSDHTQVMRAIHTIKGTSAFFGVQSISDLCHAVEERCRATALSGEDRELLSNRWSELSTELGVWANALNGQHHMNLANEEVDELRAAVAACAPYPKLAEMLARLKLEPLSVILGRLARQGSALAKQLGKDVDVVVEPSTLRVDGAALAPIFSSLVHAMRNAVDHGVDEPDDRVAHGKPRRARIVLRAMIERRGLLLEVSDDGAGVDWPAVRAQALARGLPNDTPADLLSAILSDGFSTRSEVTQISGRGLGLAALRAAAEALDGSLTILSLPKLGSRLQVWLPCSVVWPEPKRVAA